MIVVGVDPGRTCGWAIVRSVAGRESVADLGVVDGRDIDAVAQVLRLATAYAIQGEVLRLAGERWDAAGMRRAGLHRGTAQGLEASFALWRALWTSGAFGLRAKEVLRAYPREWRKAVLGRGGGLDSSAWKIAAAGYATALSGRLVESPDAAEAACVAVWGARQPLTGRSRA